MIVQEGNWDCSQCNTTGIPGLQLTCPLCGDSRNTLLDPDEKPYLPDDARTITDEEGLRRSNAGPDWNCGACGATNIATEVNCSECGKPLSSDDDVSAVTTYVSGVDAAGVELVGPKQLEDDRTDLILESADPLRELETEPLKMPSRSLHASHLPRVGIAAARNSAARLSKTFGWGGKRYRNIGLGVLALVAAIIGCVILYGAYFKTTTVQVSVVGLSWERQVEVEEFRTLRRQDWSVPSDGRVLDSFRAIHHYNRVVDHYKTVPYQVGERVQTGSHTERYACGSRTVDRGNGTFSSETTYCTRVVPDYTTKYHTEYRREAVYRDDPVYRTKYVFEIDRWVTDHFVRAAGERDGQNPNPYWPRPKRLSEEQRVGDERPQSYTAFLIDEESRRFERKLDYRPWALLSIGMTLNAQQTRQGRLKEVSWPSRKPATA